jgi:[glutamine synthetase] adenylyltransferase / [glutamine synthetase]-adenylyl-L-tyrosine phosphorylase
MNDNQTRVHFEDPGRSTVLIHKLIEPLIGSFDEGGEPYNPEELHRIVLDAVIRSPAPDKAVLNLHRMTDAMFGTSFIRDLVRYPVLLDLAVKIGSYSQFLSDIVVRDPELFRWLTTTEVLSISRSRDDFIKDLEKQIDLFGKRTAQYNAIRRFYRREILRIGVRDILSLVSFDIIVSEISDLAEAISTVILRMVVEDTAVKYSGKPVSPFAVIGLGKLGGRELNYSSDIDVMFVLDEDESFESGSGRKMHAIDFYRIVADRWIAVMTEHSKEGSLYRVDARLRPDGDAGPLVRSAQGFRTYYEMRGELWERQMLIKARTIAGDADFGRWFIESLQPFIYPATFFQSPRQTVARMKARIENRSGDPNNIKLCRGGIRDIEFIVQTLQLLIGGKDYRVRSNTTLASIKLLHSAGYLNREEQDALQHAYIFFRGLEHLLQLDQNIQTHSLPVGELDREQFARKSGFESKEKFDSVLHENLDRVAKIFDDVFKSEEHDSLVEFMFAGEESGDKADLSDFGFVDENRARELLKQLAHGMTAFGIGEHDSQTKEVLRTIAPGLLRDFSSALNPDRALMNFLSVVRGYPHPQSFFVSIQNESVRKVLIKVCGFSNKLAMGLARFPEDLELMINNAAGILESVDITKSDVEHYTDRFLNLAIHARFINGSCPLQEVHRVLSFIAVRRIRRVLYEIYSEFNLNDPGIVIAALGKLSGDELGPGGDLDLIFLYDEQNGMDAEIADKVAREFIRRCARVVEPHSSFEIDMRLRPEGKSGPLAVSVDAYKHYLDKRASLWERQSLVRARVVDGPDRMKSQVMDILEEYVYKKALTAGWVDEIREMRFRTESRSRINRHDFINVKTGPGGIMDIEFLVQAAQLSYGKDKPSMRSTSTRDALNRLRDLEIYEEEALEILENAYDLYRNVEYFNRIYAEDPSHLIPDSAEEQNNLMNMLKINKRPAEYFTEVTKKVRDLFLIMISRVER